MLDHGRFILGPEVAGLEEELARRSGAAHVVTCSSGTDGLLLALLAWGVGAGDAVFVPAFTFAATAEAVVRAGGTPVLVDVHPDTCCIDPGSLDEAVTWSQSKGLRGVGVIAVDLYGQPAEYGPVRALASEHGLWVLADAAQSFGGSLEGRAVGSLADATVTSFFPAKPLGCYGDGGAVFTDDQELAARMRSLRVHGRDGDDFRMVGLNGRLDTVQAAVVLAKLEIFDEELQAREKLARRYSDALAEAVTVPTVLPGARSAWACYTVRSPSRAALAHRLSAAGVGWAVYYPRPLHRTTAFVRFPRAPGGLAVSERLAAEVLSVPVHPYLDDEAVGRVIDAVRSELTFD